MAGPRPNLPAPYEWGDLHGNHFDILIKGRRVGSYGGAMLATCGWADIPYTLAKIEREAARGLR